MSESRRPPPPAVNDRRRNATPHWNPGGLRPPIAQKASPPQPAPGFQDFFTRRFELARWLLNRHTRLAASRANTALLLAVIDLMAAALSIWLYAQATASGMMLFLRAILLVLVLLVLGCILLALLFSLGAATWHRSNPDSPGETDWFFESGSTPPNTGAIPQDSAQFQQLFRQSNQEAMLASAVNALFAQAQARQVQERRLRRAIICTVSALLVTGLVTSITFVGML